MTTSIPYLSTAYLGGVGEWGLCDEDDSAPVVLPSTPSSTTSKSVSMTSSMSERKKSEKRDFGSESSVKKPHASQMRSETKSRVSRVEAPATAPAASKRSKPHKPSLVDEDLFMQVMGTSEKSFPKTPTKLKPTQTAQPRQNMADIKADLQERSSYSNINSDTALWVEEYLQTACLNWALSLFAELEFSLELVPFLETKQVDDIFSHVKLSERADGDFADLDLIVEKVKLICALRAMKVHLQAAARINSLETLEPRNVPGSSPLMISTDVASWTVEMVNDWLASVPVLKHLQGLFRSNKIDGHALLRLNERKLMQVLKIGSPVDRRLLLQHISDLTALQSSSSFVPVEVVQKLPAKSLGASLRESSSSRHRERSQEPSSKPSKPHTHAHAHIASPSASRVSSAAAVADDKKTPNFFLSLRIDNSQIQDMVRALQEEVMNEIPVLRGSKCVLDPSLLHFTVGRLILSTPEEEQRAKEILKDAVRIYDRIYRDRSASITFKSIANHGGNAVFVETEFGQERDDLTEFGNTVFEMFKDAGLASRNFRFQPVAPIIRIHSNKKEAVAPLREFFSTRLMPRYESHVIGRHTFTSIEISSVSPEHHSGYYDALASCSWAPSAN
eukprot:TRINITY_DN15400_c0_g1_i1.p1 TRINITY_DN15400_c0_g1~~TRINITY_DN15400_c0_g1_i1.p1  ORF type:complete len:617 (+),score=149.38 TRINITY_DN15400_c0_g1_i1:176-2026(+)